MRTEVGLHGGVRRRPGHASARTTLDTYSPTLLADAFRQQGERDDVPWVNHAEVGAVGAGDLGDTEPFSDGDDGSVRDAHRTLDVGLGQLSHACVVGDSQLDRLEVAVGKTADDSTSDRGEYLRIM